MTKKAATKDRTQAQTKSETTIAMTVATQQLMLPLRDPSATPG